MKSLEFFKLTLATTLAIVLTWLLSVRPAQAGYVVTLQQVGPNVVATGSGPIDLTGLSFLGRAGTMTDVEPSSGGIFTGVTGRPDLYQGTISGPMSFGFGGATYTNTASGDMVAMYKIGNIVVVPAGYVSGTALSDTATWFGQTFATLYVRPGTYVWTWGPGANQNFTLQIGPATNVTSIINMSTRASVQTGQGTMIAGFTITGTDPKQVVIRGLGPRLAVTPFNMPGTLADPTLGLYDGSGTPIFSNNDWTDTQGNAISAAGLEPYAQAESAIFIALQPGKYTAILSGNHGTSGVGLVEVYDAITSAVVSAELTNVSTRGLVGVDQNPLIAGFITSGANISTDVVVRGLGPTLAQFGVSGALADPVVTLVDGNGTVIQSNNDWKNTQQAAAIQKSGFAPPNDVEAAILATVLPGNYTAILSGNAGATGIGLVEIYKLP